LARATLVQASGHVGDRDAVARTVLDQRWPLVLDGLGAALPPFRPSTLCNLRMRLSAHTVDKTLLDRTVALAETTGGCGARQRRAGLDSPPLCGAGRVEATLHLRGHAWRKAVGLAAQALGASAEAMLAEAGWVLVGHSSRKAALDLDWGQPKASEQARRWGRAAGDRWTRWLEQPQRLSTAGLPRQAVRDPIAPMATQDIAPDPEGGPGGKRLQTPVAPDRRLAMEAAAMRHGRKSSANTCNGVQAHGVLDLARHVPREGVVRPAHEPAHEAVALWAAAWEQNPGLLHLDIDLGSRASPRMAPWAQQGVSSSARPWPQGGTRFTQDDCPLAFAPGRLTGPPGQRVPMVPGQDAQCPASACAAWPGRALCTNARIGPGRRLHLRADEPCQQKLRAKLRTPRGRAALRPRTAVEHAISRQLAHQGRRARYKGLRKNPFAGRRQAAVSHLQVAVHYAEEHQLAS
jgi:hypothetical protein